MPNAKGHIDRSRPDVCPPIAPVPEGTARPFWSVMIPTYNPSGLLEATLRSVLDQDPGPDRMQIAVVDDASPDVDVQTMVRAIAGERAEYHRNLANLRLAGNWNHCIELARGRWVHLLHQDDLILPGFYAALAAADAHPEVGAAFCQHLWINGASRWTTLSPLEREAPGILDDWLGRIADQQRIQCASIVVRRDVYEELGGYRTDLIMAMDWEMWVRIAAHVSVWYEPTVLAAYRFHQGSETTRLRRESEALEDITKAMDLMRRSLPEGVRARVGVGMRPILHAEFMKEATMLMHAGDHRGGLVKLRRAGRLAHPLHFLPTRLAYYRWALKISALRLIGRSPGRPAAPTSGAEEA